MYTVNTNKNRLVQVFSIDAKLFFLQSIFLKGCTMVVELKIQAVNVEKHDRHAGAVKLLRYWSLGSNASNTLPYETSMIC